MDQCKYKFLIKSEKQRRRELSKSVIHYMPPTMDASGTEQCKKSRRTVGFRLCNRSMFTDRK